MYFLIKYILLLIFLFKPIYNGNCKMKTHDFFLLPINKENNEESSKLTGLAKFDYMLILKTEPRNDDNYHLVLNVTFPININIDISGEIIYEFESLEKFCISDIRARKYINIFGDLSEYETENTILQRIWIKIESILMDKEVEKIRNQNFYLLTNYSLTDNKDKKYILMKKISYEPQQTFQILYVSIHQQNLLMDNNNYVCEDYSGPRNELSIGDELTTLIRVDRIRESSDYNVFDQSRKKYLLSNVQNLVCIYYTLTQFDEKC